MSERMTAIDLPGVWDSGVADYGLKTVPEMLALLRSRAKHMKETAEAILTAKDTDFTVQTYVGAHVQRNRKVLQVGKQVKP